MESIRFRQILDMEKDGANCSLAQIGSFRVMFDCGIDEHASPSLISRVEEALEGVDCLLLTHPTFRHIGSLPFLSEKMKEVNIFATFPVIKFGVLSLYEFFLAQMEVKKFEGFELKDVDEVMGLINPLNFKQKRQYAKKGKKGILGIEASHSGHSLGGCMWKIQFSTNSLVYAFDINDKSECIS